MCINFIEIKEVDKGSAKMIKATFEPGPPWRKKAAAINDSAAEEKIQQLR